MKYKLHRVAKNSEGWVRPSPGRLGAPSMGEYVKINGFGIEDWNFNFNLASNGEMLGFTEARPSVKRGKEEFGVILAIYDSSVWSAVGYYKGARFMQDADPHNAATILQMATDVFELAENDSVAPRYREMTFAEIQEQIRKELFRRHCLIPTNGVFVFEPAIEIPRELFGKGGYRMSTSYNLSEDAFHKIIGLTNSRNALGIKQEWAEGERTLKLHKSRERNQALVAAFKQRLTSFACVICAFDFERRYGPLGANFIECHHVRPLAEMRPGEATTLNDLRAVCSNCHRMLHKALPMLSIEQLRELVETVQPA